MNRSQRCPSFDLLDRLSFDLANEQFCDLLREDLRDDGTNIVAANGQRVAFLIGVV